MINNQKCSQFARHSYSKFT